MSGFDFFQFRVKNSILILRGICFVWQLAGIYKNVIATDISQEQLDFAVKLPNIRYECNPPTMSNAEVEQIVGAESSVDLVTSAEAMHWFDLPNFYKNVNWVLKKPNGVIATWSYTLPEISPTVDSLLQKLYSRMADPYFKPQSKLVLEGKYKTIDFPFEAVDGLEHNGPFEFKMEKTMVLDNLFSLVKSWSAYKAAKGDGVEFLSDDVVEEFTSTWNEDGKSQKLATYPIYLRMGKVGGVCK